jgi:hypothetical protein
MGFNLLLNPYFMSPGIFPPTFFDQEFKAVMTLLSDRSAGESANVRYMDGIWKAVNSAPHNPRAIASLKAYLDEIDRRRHTDWRATFPWLVEVH